MRDYQKNAIGVILLLFLSTVFFGCSKKDKILSDALRFFQDSLTYALEDEFIMPEMPAKFKGVEASYISLNENVLTNDGKIVQTKEEQTVFIDIKVTYKKTSRTMRRSLLIKKMSDEKMLEDALTYFEFYITYLAERTSLITYSERFAYWVTWTTDSDKVQINSSGFVSYSGLIFTNTQITLTATFRYLSATAVKEFKVYVKSSSSEISDYYSSIANGINFEIDYYQKIETSVLKEYKSQITKIRDDFENFPDEYKKFIEEKELIALEKRLEVSLSET